MPAGVRSFPVPGDAVTSMRSSETLDSPSTVAVYVAPGARASRDIAPSPPCSGTPTVTSRPSFSSMYEKLVR